MYMVNIRSCHLAGLQEGNGSEQGDLPRIWHTEARRHVCQLHGLRVSVLLQTM